MVTVNSPPFAVRGRKRWAAGFAPSLRHPRALATSATTTTGGKDEDDEAAEADKGLAWHAKDENRPENWTRRVFAQTEVPYFYNVETNEIAPDDTEEDAQSGGGGPSASWLAAYTPLTVEMKHAGMDEVVERELRFKEFRNLKDDRPYYLNCASLETSWKFPYEDQDEVWEIPPLPEFEFKHRVGKEVPDAPVLRRLGAASIDLTVSAVVTGGVLAFMYFDLDKELYTVLPATAPIFFAAFSVRDTVLDMGTRSIGKKLMGLEVIDENGLMPSRGHSIIRNLYLAPMLVAAGFFPESSVSFLVDMGLLLVTKRKAGDYLARTRVIRERSDRPRRLKEREDYVSREVRMT
jgi:uncharacterized RDD family membrane protein YckC